MGTREGKVPVEAGDEAVLMVEVAATRTARSDYVREGIGGPVEGKGGEEDGGAGGGGCGAGGGEPKAAADLKCPEGSYSSDEEAGGADWGLGYIIIISFSTHKA